MVRYKIPKRIEFATVLPTSGYGKVTTALSRRNSASAAPGRARPDHDNPHRPVLPEVRCLTQPGTPLPRTDRRVSDHPPSDQRRTARRDPTAGSVAAGVFEQGYTSAFGELRGGTFTSFDYYIPAVCQAGTSVATFSDPITGRARRHSCAAD